MSFKTVKMSVYLTTACLFLLPSLGQAQKVGFESEFATVGFMEPEWGEKQLALSKTMLEIVQGHFDGKGEIQTVRWSKYPEKNLSILIYKDPRGRTWSIDPESVNTSGLDGVEFVTPALDSPEDIERYSKIMRSLRQTKLLMRGLRSSNHVTVDVSHLTQDPNNISKLVDLILTIENHWADIYRFYDPVRYGTIINRFSVPLALDQQDLLKELAALPESQRSYNNVRNIFLKYDEKENSLRNADGSNPVRKWKYRSANYGKLFRLAPDAKGISAIEFRIGDLDFGSRIDEKADFMKKLVMSDHLDKTFKSPFGDKVLDWKQGTEVLKKSQLSSDFLKDLVDGKKLATIERKEDRKLSVNTQDVDLQDVNRPLEKSGKYITFGFEAEFKDGANARKVVKEGNSAPLDKYSYLDSKVSEEYTGNIEVRSVGGERVLAEVLEQMNTVRSTLREDLRGFHMHMRIPAEMIAQHDPEVLKAWMTNISDAVFAWRLQNRQHFFALKTKTLARQDISTIEKRGPVRLTRLDDGTWDFEIRGYMNSSEMIGMMAQKIMTGIMNPELIKTLVQEQEYLQIRKFTLLAGLEEYNKIYFKRNLTANEREVIQKLSGEVEGLGMLPLYDFAKVYDNDPVTKRKIQDATMTFFKEVSTVIRNKLSGKYASDDELSKQFRWRIKRWAQAIDLQALLEKRILISSGDKNGGALKSPYSYDRKEYYKTLKSRGDKSLAEIANEMRSPHTPVTMAAVVALRARTDAPAFELLEKLLEDPDVTVRGNAADALKGRNDARSLALIKKVIDGIDYVAKLRAIEALEGRTDAEVSVLLKKVLADYNDNIRVTAAGALKGRTDSQSLELIEKAMADSNIVVRMRAIEALAGRTDAQVFVLIKKTLGDADGTIRSSAVEILQGRPDAEFWPFIEKAMADTNGVVRANAVKALTGRTDSRSLPFLREALGDVMVIARKYAMEVLITRTDADSLLLLETILNDANKDMALRLKSMRAVLPKFDTDKFLKYYENEIKKPTNSAEFTTELKRSYILRFGSLNAKPTQAVRCERVFVN